MKWIISIASSLLILGTSGGFIFHWHKDIPAQLKNTSILTAGTSKAAGKVTKKALKDIIHETQKEVVMIELDNGTLGSGFLYNKNGDVITNAHVVNGAKKVKIKTADAREFEGTVIGISKDVDVAVVRVPGMAKDTPLKMMKKKADVGDEVLALGSPLGLQNTVTTGIISGLNRDFDIAPFHYSDAYQISAPIAPGNSGGPLINSKTGEVIGINSAGTDQGTIGFSIPIVNTLPLVEGWSSSPMSELPNLSIGDSEDGTDTEADAEESPVDTAEYLVKYFYESLNSSDFVTAYSLLGSSWQKNLDFTKFRNGYLNTRSNSLDEIQTLQDGDICTVTAILTAEELKNGNYVYSKYKVEYTIGYENDQLKLLSGTGKKIQ
ncbi:trypsin-like peptidase domain-containing protein [Neobacillus sp. PS3-34]|uniref:S1C family serine protease n=1 Tax=Neobacillus sp. PS3-34 TaxID=3070678 RepID=UPI0027E0FC28|nr:trypsin-like peptidase domain-containing protein [Neobacillus sp. PS3-34]WML46705.1 trypsin-like peptidase domain-containing protein [Neobacillus sp. PS3-34]